MISLSETFLTPDELGEYGHQRIKFLVFDAVQKLWHRREEEGLKQKDLAERIGRDPAWVSKNLRGPANWTLRTLGEFVQGLDGELELSVHAMEDPIAPRPNYHAYAEYELPLTKTDVTIVQIESPQFESPKDYKLGRIISAKTSNFLVTEDA